MKVIKVLVDWRYVEVKRCSSFLSWIWHTTTYPQSTREMGSGTRVLYRRRFGWEKETLVKLWSDEDE